MIDRTKETSEATTPKKTLVEDYRKRAAMLTEARQTYAETIGLDNLKYGRTALSEVQRQRVLKTIEKGGRITSDGTLQLTASPIEGGMSGEGSSQNETYEQCIERHKNERKDLRENQRKDMKDLIEVFEEQVNDLIEQIYENPNNENLKSELSILRMAHIQEVAEMMEDHEEDYNDLREQHKAELENFD